MTTIDKVVRGAIADKGYKTLHKYLLYLHFAFDAFYKLKRDNVILIVKVLELTVASRRVTVPANVLGISGIGFQKGARILPFITDGRLSLDPAAIPSSTDATDVGRLVRYRYDRALAQIVFETVPEGGKVYLEVVESGVSASTETVIVDEAILPMKAFIHYRQSRFRTGAASAETKASETEYFDELDEALGAQSDLTAEGIIFALLTKRDDPSSIQRPYESTP